MILWAFVIVFCTTCTARSHVDQPDKVITVELGSSVTLRCISCKDSIFWYKQAAGQQPRVISAFQKLPDPLFYNEFRNERFRGNRLSCTSNLTISGIIQSDEAVYYCASRAYYTDFGNGTHLIIKGQESASKIVRLDNLNNPIEFQQKCNENTTRVKNDVSEEKLYPAVLGLACALGLCGGLVFALIAFIFSRVRSSGRDKPIRGHSSAQDTDDENVTYAALRFNQKKK